eukprot:gb/GFBE01040800.1/.p1 GENE.gb/GFBE01040800.1/~~gb/GFBE01040800.1/.p1  ORF type:complete len:432 (+),score=59.95 gb/GFBE01040800.1/:1-1296(+)
MAARREEAPSADSEVDLESQDPCRLLGVTPEATERQVKAAYMKLSRQYAPTSDAPEDSAATSNYQQVLFAYEMLRDSDKGKLWRSIGRLPDLLDRYGAQPRPIIFMEVYTVLYDACTSRLRPPELLKLRNVLHGEVSRQVRQLAKCLQLDSVDQVISWMKEVLQQIFQIRNRLYVLQAASQGMRCQPAGFGCVEVFDVKTRIAQEWQETKMEELSNVFWDRVTSAVEAEENSAELLQTLSGLADALSRCGGTTITARRVPIPEMRQELVGALRALSHKFLAPPEMPALVPFSMASAAPAGALRAFQQIVHRRPLLSNVFDHLSEEDIASLYGLKKEKKRKRQPSSSSGSQQPSPAPTPVRRERPAARPRATALRPAAGPAPTPGRRPVRPRATALRSATGQPPAEGQRPRRQERPAVLRRQLQRSGAGAGA